MRRRSRSAIEELGIIRRTGSPRDDYDSRVLASIKDEMRAQGVSQSELARRSGISESMISRLLNRKRRPSPQSVRKIADALGVSADSLMPRDGRQDVGCR